MISLRYKMLLFISAVMWPGAKVINPFRPGHFYSTAFSCSMFDLRGPNGFRNLMPCAPGLYFNNQTSKCDYAQNVDCTSRGGYTHPDRWPDLDVTDEKAVYWGPSLPKGRCQHVYCSLFLKTKGSNPFTPADIDPRLCSHLVVKNVRFEPSGQLTLASWYVPGSEQDAQSDVDRAFTELRRLKLNQSYPDVKLLAAAGYLDKVLTWTDILVDNTVRLKLAYNVTSFLRAQGFDGLVLHIDMTRTPMYFVSRFLTDLMTSFQNDSVSSGLPRLSLGLTVPADEDVINKHFPGSFVSEDEFRLTLTEKVDILFLMVQDMRVQWRVSTKGVTRHGPGEWTVKKAVRKWERLGAAANRIVFGVSLGVDRYSLHSGRRETASPLSQSTVSFHFGNRVTDFVYGAGYSLLNLTPDLSDTVTLTEDTQSLTEKTIFVAAVGLGGIWLTDLNYDDAEGQSIRSSARPIKLPLTRTAVEACALTPDSDSHPDPAMSHKLTAIGEVPHEKPACSVLFCFYQKLSETGSAQSILRVQDINGSYCTHLAYVSFVLTTWTLGQPIYMLPISKSVPLAEMARQMVELKRKYPHLVLMLGVEDPKSGNSTVNVNFRELVLSDEDMERIALHAVVMLRSLQFDGVDFNFNYPPYDKLIKMLRTFMRVFEKEAEHSGMWRLKLSVCIHSSHVGHAVQEIRDIAAIVDVLRYDITTSVMSVRGQPKDNDGPGEARFNYSADILTALAWFERNKFRPENIVLSVNFVGSAFHVLLLPENQFYIIRHLSLPHSRKAGYSTYYEVCQLRDTRSSREWYLADQSGQFLTYNDSGQMALVIFEDEMSLRDKTAAIAKLGYAGVFVDNIAADDFSGEFCGNGAFPLLTAIASECAEIRRKTKVTDASAQIPKEELAATPLARCTYLVCYYNNQASLRPGDGKMSPLDIDPTSCSHLIYSHAVLNGIRVQNRNPEDVGETGMYAEINRLRDKNPVLKTLLSVRVCSALGATFRNLVKDQTTMDAFAISVVSFLHQHKFDGIEIDCWENNGLNLEAADRDGLSKLMHTLSNKLKRENLLLAIKLSGKQGVIQQMYSIPSISAAVDLILLNTYSWYDWHVSVHHHSPLFRRRTGPNADMNVNNTVQAAVTLVLSLGAAAHKLVLGIGLYGHSFTLSNPYFSKPGDGSITTGRKSNYTRQFGMLTSYEACQIRNLPETTVRFIEEQLVPYMVHGDQWIAFEDQVSVRQKVRFSKLLGLGGVSVWALDADDFMGAFCGFGPYPLLKAIQDECRAHARVVPEGGSLLQTPSAMKRVCYISERAFSRDPVARFNVSAIPPGLCSHLIFQYFTVQEDGDLLDLDAETVNVLQAMQLLASQDDQLVLMASIRGAREGTLLNVTRTDEKQTLLLERLTERMDNYDIQGVDMPLLDYSADNAYYYNHFITKLRATLSANNTVIMSVGLGRRTDRNLTWIQYERLSRDVDFVNVFSFGYSTGWERLTHDALMEDFQYSLNDYLLVGIPARKLVGGLSLDAKVFYQSDPSRHNAGDPASVGPMANTTHTPGRWPYYEVCSYLLRQAGNPHGVGLSGYDDRGVALPRQSPVYYNGRVWVSYESQKKVQDKVAWLKEQGFGGYHLHTLDDDVFTQSLCASTVEAFPIALAAHQASRNVTA